MNENTSDEDDILDEQADDDDVSLSDPSDATHTSNEDLADTYNLQEFRSGNSRHETRSKESRSEELDDSGDSTSDEDKVKGADLDSDVNSDNIMDRQRTRMRNTQANIDSFAGTRYQVNMLNIADDDFKRFKKISLDLYSKTVGTCFAQMTANKGMKLVGEIAVAAMFKEYKQLDDFDTNRTCMKIMSLLFCIYVTTIVTSA